MKLSIPDPSPGTLVKFHFVMMITWALLGIPTVIWWKESILWVAFMSLWANIASHFGAWDGARAEEAVHSNSDDTPTGYRS